MRRMAEIEQAVEAQNGLCCADVLAHAAPLSAQ